MIEACKALTINHKSLYHLIHHHLKQLRENAGMTLKQLSTKVGYGTGNLSSYENGKLNAKDETVIRILTRGFDFSEKEAKVRVAEWRKEELETTYHLELAQPSVEYNHGKKKSSQNLKAFLKAEGFDAKAIRKIVDEAKKYQ